MRNYDHTKNEQWRAFSRVVKTDLFEYPDAVLIVKLDEIQEQLDCWVNSITNECKNQSEVAIEIAKTACKLYSVLTNSFVSWDTFSNHVEFHIIEYVTPQYGNFPDKTIAKFTAEKIQGKLEAYTDRIGKSSRGQRDGLRDSLKIAHFGCYLYCLITTGNAQMIPKCCQEC